ncbi:MAG: sulfotransferase family 2 domain-containing protein [Pseudomonadota bacterium]
MRDPFLVHCHIPKTGGSALNRRFLFARFGEKNVHQMYRYVFERFSSLPMRHRARSMRSFAASGHVPFGYFDQIYPEAVYISVIREPVARFVSFLNFVASEPGHAVYQRLCQQGVDPLRADPECCVAAALSDPHLKAIHCNATTRLAGGQARLGRTLIDWRIYEAALANLAKARYLVGLQSELPEFMARLAISFGAPAGPVSVPAKLEKRLGRRISISDLAPATVNRIAQANDLDRRLYDHVRSMMPREATERCASPTPVVARARMPKSVESVELPLAG